MKNVKKQARKAVAVRKKRVRKERATKVQAATPPVTAQVKPAEGRASSKKDLVIGLLQREGGATLEELMNVTGWQKHSVRGFLSTLRKKLGLPVERVSGEGTAMIYRITTASA